MATATALVYGEPEDPAADLFTRRRRTGIGGSDAGAILGVSPFASALSVWEDKRGLSVPDRDRPSERMLWGSRLEGAILDGYAADNRVGVRRTGRHFRRHPVHPFVVGHPDGFANSRLLEVKTTAYLDQRWGEDGSADVPPHYFAQVMHYLLLTGYSVCDLLVLVGGRELHTYTLPADRVFIEALLEVERLFWERVKSGEPPEPDGSESAGAAVRRMFPVAFPEEVVATPEVAAYADEYLVQRGARDMAQGLMDLNAQRMQTYMGARERLLGPGFSASWSNRAGSVSWREAAALYRDLLVPHYDDDALDAIAEGTRGAPSRTFLLSRKSRRDEG